MLQKTAGLVLNILFPPLCLTCEKYLEDSRAKVCLDCWATIPVYHYITCPVCLARVPDINSKPVCHPDARYLLAAAASYDHPAIQTIIKQFKYHGWQSLAKDLANLAVGVVTNQNIAGFVVLPLPLHPSRQRERGFNQAELLAKIIGRKLNLPAISHNLIKVRNTSAQARSADWRARENNVQDSFALTNPDGLRSKNILLIDDVSTSGATLNEAARVLKSAGVKKIIALVIARAR